MMMIMKKVLLLTMLYLIPVFAVAQKEHFKKTHLPCMVMALSLNHIVTLHIITS